MGIMKQEKLLEQKIGLRLSRIGLLSKVFANQTFSKHGFDIRPEQFTVLMTLKENNGMYQRQLAYYTFKDRPNITRIVSILEKKGYITSQITSDGRQVKKLFITPKGIEECEKILPVILKIWTDTIGDLTGEEVSSFLNTLDKIENNLRERTLLQI